MCRRENSSQPQKNHPQQEGQGRGLPWGRRLNVCSPDPLLTGWEGTARRLEAPLETLWGRTAQRKAPLPPICPNSRSSLILLLQRWSGPLGNQLLLVPSGPGEGDEARGSAHSGPLPSGSAMGPGHLSSLSPYSAATGPVPSRSGSGVGDTETVFSFNPVNRPGVAEGLQAPSAESPTCGWRVGEHDAPGLSRAAPPRHKLLFPRRPSLGASLWLGRQPSPLPPRGL